MDAVPNCEYLPEIQDAMDTLAEEYPPGTALTGTIRPLRAGSKWSRTSEGFSPCNDQWIIDGDPCVITRVFSSEEQAPHGGSLPIVVLPIQLCRDGATSDKPTERKWLNGRVLSDYRNHIVIYSPRDENELFVTGDDLEVRGFLQEIHFNNEEVREPEI